MFGGAYRVWSVLVAMALLLAACAAETPVADPPTDEAEAARSDDEEVDTANEVEEPASLEGEVLSAIVPYPPGGGFDAYMRIVAPAMADVLGASNAVILNQAGAGGLIGMNNLAIEEPDGTSVALFAGHIMALFALAEQEGVRFDPLDLAYIGSLQEPFFLFVVADSPYGDLTDIADDDDFAFGSAAPGDLNWITARVIQEVLGVERTIVSGFDGGVEIQTALHRGDLEAYVSPLFTAIAAVEAGEERPLVNVSLERDPNFPEVPALIEYAQTDEHRELVEAHVALTDLNRVLVGPPGMTEDVLTMLRTAFDSIMSDEEFLSRAESLGRPMFSRPGAETEQIVKTLLLEPPDVYVSIIREEEE